jgi:hypothetical protein
MPRSFNALEPFADAKFLEETKKIVANFKFKLYGVMNPKEFGKNTSTEIDYRLGGIHLTAMDYFGLDSEFKKLNDKYQTQITFCIYPIKDFPGELFLNIRSPKGRSNLSTDLKELFPELANKKQV